MTIRILAVDPSSTVVGWAALEDDTILATGTISTKGTTYDRRFTHIISQLASVRVEHRCTELALEAAFRAPGYNTAALQVAEHAVRYWAAGHMAVVGRYNVSTWKASVVGWSNATKEDIMANIQLRYPTLLKLTQHEADAVGIGVHHYGVRRLELMAEAH